MKKSSYTLYGETSSIAEFREMHCRKLAEWFDSDGQFVANNFAPGSRERLWNCLSLFAVGGAVNCELANTIIKTTEIDDNHFIGPAAAELLLRHSDKLQADARGHLLMIVSQHYANMIDVRFGNDSTNNFSCMCTFFLIAACQLLSDYQWNVPFASTAIAYNKARMEAIAMNAVYAFERRFSKTALFDEFNSPNYTPVSLHFLACISEFALAKDARSVAESIELALWNEVFEFFHPKLNLACGPYSRAYRPNILGYVSNIRVMMNALGIMKSEPLTKLFDQTQPTMILPANNLPFILAQSAWLLTGKYHIPNNSLDYMKSRKFPYEISEKIYWQGRGQIDKTSRHLIKNVQGKAIPGGDAEAHQIQEKHFALGYVSKSRCFGHAFPIHLHYALAPRVLSMRDVRSITAAVIFHGAPEEWSEDFHGNQVETINFHHAGRVKVLKTETGVDFYGKPLGEFADIAAAELSVNSFIPIHFSCPEKIVLNDIIFHEETLTTITKSVVCHIEDSGFVYELYYEFPQPVEVRLFKWGNFIRFAGFWHQGEKKVIDQKLFGIFNMTGNLRILKNKTGER